MHMCLTEDIYNHKKAHIPCCKICNQEVSKSTFMPITLLNVVRTLCGPNEDNHRMLGAQYESESSHSYIP